MKGKVQIALILAVGICFSAVFIAGCEEGQSLSQGETSTKRTRLIAVENAQLKKQVQELKIMHSRQMDRQKKLLEKCQTEKKALEELTDQNINEFMGQASEGALEENTRLRMENAELKSEIEQLRVRITQLESR
jgi:hypothetical protein